MNDINASDTIADAIARIDALCPHSDMISSSCSCRDLVARLQAVRGERASRDLSETVALLRAQVRETATVPGARPRLRDALIGQRSDVTFYGQWEANKATLVRVLDALDAAMPAPPADVRFALADDAMNAALAADDAKLAAMGAYDDEPSLERGDAIDMTDVLAHARAVRDNPANVAPGNRWLAMANALLRLDAELRAVRESAARQGWALSTNEGSGVVRSETIGEKFARAWPLDPRGQRRP